MQKQYAESKEYSEIGYYIASFYRTRSGNFNPMDVLTLQYKEDNIKAIETCDLCMEKFPGSYGANMCKSLKNEIMTKSLTS